VLSQFILTQAATTGLSGAPGIGIDGAGGPGGASMLPGMMMAAGVLILTVWALFRLKSSRSKRHTKRLVGPTAFATATGKRPLPLSQPGGQKSDPGPTGVQDPAVLRTTLQAVMVDAQEVTRLCAAQIENRAAMLDRLIADGVSAWDRAFMLLAEAKAAQAAGENDRHREAFLALDAARDTLDGPSDIDTFNTFAKQINEPA